MAKRKKPFIPAQRKQALRRRAEAAATRQHAPLLQAARGGVRQANRDFRREKQSVLGADTLLQQSMNRQLKGTQKSGLKGRYKQQTLAELRAIKAGSKASIPGLLADAGAARRDAVAEARSSVAAARADRDVTAAKKYNTLLDLAIGRKAKAVKEKRESAGKPKLNRSAMIAAKALMDKWHANAPVRRVDPETGEEQIVPFRELNPLKTGDQLRDAALGIAKTKGVSVEDALKALFVLRRQDKRRSKRFLGTRASGRADLKEG